MHPHSPADVRKERDASKLRLLNVWSSLAERYTRRLDEDDIVDIRTGKITTDRGFIRNSRKINFGTIVAPTSGDVIDEGTDDEDEYDTDELDAFAHTTSDITEQIEMPPVTALDSADAEDLRAFLEAERKRKDYYGSEVEDDHSGSTDVEHLRAFLEAERRRKDFCESEVEDSDDYSTASGLADAEDLCADQKGSERRRKDFFEVKDDYSAASGLAEAEDLCADQKGYEHRRKDFFESEVKDYSTASGSADVEDLHAFRKRRRKNVCGDEVEENDYSMPDQGQYAADTSESYLTALDLASDDELDNWDVDESSAVYPVLKQKGNDSDIEIVEGPTRNVRTPNSLALQKQEDNDSDIEIIEGPTRNVRMLGLMAPQKSTRLAKSKTEKRNFIHDSSFIPHTPSQRHRSRRANSTFNTPTDRPHPHPYSYNPDLSLATLPPESPESISSPDKSSHGPLKSSMASLRSRSRGRRVSFAKPSKEKGKAKAKDSESSSEDSLSSPSKPPVRYKATRGQGRQNFTKPSKGKGKAEVETLDSQSSSEDPLNFQSDGDVFEGSSSRTEHWPPERHKIWTGSLNGVPKVVA